MEPFLHFQNTASVAQGEKNHSLTPLRIGNFEISSSLKQQRIPHKFGDSPRRGLPLNSMRYSKPEVKKKMPPKKKGQISIHCCEPRSIMRHIRPRAQQLQHRDINFLCDAVLTAPMAHHALLGNGNGLPQVSKGRGRADIVEKRPKGAAQSHISFSLTPCRSPLCRSTRQCSTKLYSCFSPGTQMKVRVSQVREFYVGEVNPGHTAALCKEVA